MDAIYRPKQKVGGFHGIGLITKRDGNDESSENGRVIGYEVVDAAKEKNDMNARKRG